ncbi:MAG: hypothetical protein L0209_11715 [candidate division Zixibacteria bacterium]|nr:hypothetical protein [candidate division Zixibacteria bacterium]
MSKSREALNFFLNHPKIHPNISPDGTGYIDAGELLSRPDTYFFNFGGGAVLFIASRPNEYRIDAYFLSKKEKNGRIREAIEFMFLTGAEKIIAEIPAFNRPSRYMAAHFGFSRAGTSGQWIRNGKSYDIVRYQLVRKWEA